jgi:2-phosphosulfolactate phosphatase
MIHWHIIEGESGCRFAVEHSAVAVVVDALRASATAAMLFDAGARELWVIREVEEAFTLRERMPEALLFGERGGLPPEGFDFGNSPREVQAARDRQVIFTTTTGAGRLVSAWGVPALYLGTTLNASAVARAAAAQDRDVVLIPAGLTGAPDFDAQEDWAAATAIAMVAGDIKLGEGHQAFFHWRDRIESEGLETLFQTAPHAGKLRQAGLEADIAFCAQIDFISALPKAVRRDQDAIVVRNAAP